MRQKRFVFVQLGIAIACLGGCEAAPSVKTAAQCFPEAAQPWIISEKPKSLAAAAQAAGGNATVYVDRSGSMVGYLDGANNLERPLQDLITTLPATLRLMGHKSAFRSFGTAISAPLDNGAGLAGRAAFTCAPGAAGSCDNKESRLDVVLEAVKSKDELAVVISDLWFSNSDIQTTGITALQPLLTEILLSGRVVAIYGIDSPFAGKIYDLPQPGLGATTMAYVGRHPLYMLVIGSKASVVEFGDKLAGSGPKFLATGLAAGTVRRALFAIDPGQQVRADKAPLSLGKHPRLRPDYLPLPQGVEIQRFALTRGLPEKRGAAAPDLPQWTGPKSSDFLKDVVWSGPTESRTRIWLRNDENCTKSSWLSRSESDLGWSAAREGQRRFSLDPARLVSAFSSKGVYLVVGEVRRTSVSQPNPASAWMRGDWNLEPEQAQSVAQARPRVFPTLNLSEFGRIMEGALAAAAQKKDQPIAGFATLVKVED
ncbi:hypothetical protein [Sphingomonas colocasiae]|uniref:VWA domain-containing protein n=1 Tax=Sphingomonas colocasiae TaxID=1848973 RepID=A0ABS7PXZ6_9SPHN|nr:hypothetical protein [Sphingomonas colocasiae]MBY8825525.1 hypothetical protein [Sphingomonas colocasiae]